MEAPELPYRPREPARRDHGIGIVGCGAISASHLRAYRAAGYRVVALANPTVAKAEARRAEFFPDAAVHREHRALLDDPRVEVVDVATHPDVRVPIVRDALEAGKHVLSQKPFVTDLDAGEALCALAEERRVRLAVNQNGRWAPHFAWMRAAVAAGLVGALRRVEMRVEWDHSWVAGTKFDETRHLILFDFGVHWFDMLTVLFGERAALEVRATERRAGGQRTRQPLRAEAHVGLEGGSARLAFDGAASRDPLDRTVVEGELGSLVSEGPSLQEQSVSLHTAAGAARPVLQGRWFDDGFRGTMAELLCAIEEDREPFHGARANLRSLALAFAACASAGEGGAPKTPGEVRSVGGQR